MACSLVDLMLPMFSQPAAEDKVVPLTSLRVDLIMKKEQ